MNIRKTLVALFIAALSLPIQADDSNKYLIFTQADGAEVSYSLDGLRLSFADGQVSITSTEASISYATSALRNMYFSPTASAVHATRTQHTVVTPSRGELAIAAPAGTQARVYDAQGRLIYSARIDGNPIRITSLTPGLYTVRAGSQTIKVLAR